MKSFTQRWREASDEAEDQPMEDTPTDPKEAPDERHLAYWKRIAEGRYNQMQTLSDAITELRAALAEQTERAEKAEAFKAWVHNWLDKNGVPHDPDPEHTQQCGCRINGRMAFLRSRAELAEMQLSEALKQIQQATERAEAEVERLSQELDWQNHRNSGHPTKGGFEFYINEEWTGLASAAIDSGTTWQAALRKHRIDPDDERVRIRRVAEDDAILKENTRLTAELDAARKERDDYRSTITSVINQMPPECIVHVTDLPAHVSDCATLSSSVDKLKVRRYRAQARVAELEKLIQDAPHEAGCHFPLGWPNQFKCTCWKSRLAPTQQASAWRPIDEDARNAEQVIGYHPEWVNEEFNPDGVRSCVYDGETWHSASWVDDDLDILHHNTGSPTHWQPLPAPPEEKRP